jgi:hypothetical protein
LKTTWIDHHSWFIFRTLRVKRFLVWPSISLCLHEANGDSHRPNNVNFSHPWMASPATRSNNVQNVFTHPTHFASHYVLPIFSWSGLELKESISINGQWHIEQCATNSFIQCSTFQKSIGVKCITKINVSKTTNGTLVPCYSGLWVALWGKTLEHHKHWFCVDNLNRCVGGIMWKCVVVRSQVPMF